MSDTPQLVRTVIPGTDNVAIPMPPPQGQLDIFFRAYGWYHLLSYNRPEFPKQSWLFRQIVTMLWGENNKVFQFAWHPWAEAMNEEVHTWENGKYDYVGLSGCKDSGKTHFLAAYGLVNWMAAPLITKVAYTSTTMSDSKKRGWKAIRDLYLSIGGDKLGFGKMTDSKAIIRSRIDDKFDDACGLEIVAGDKSQEGRNISRLIGFKMPRYILCADELPELSMALQDAAQSNMQGGNRERFQMIGCGNFKSTEDAFGVFVRPKAGYDSISVTDDRWETEIGTCLHFDGERSPNVLAGKDEYPFLYGLKDLKGHRQLLGEKSANYWRMCRSFHAPTGAEDTIYTEADLISGKVFALAIQYRGVPVKLAALDPAFTTGGDRAQAIIGLLGVEANSGQQILCVSRYEALAEDATKKDKPRPLQIVEQFTDLCQRDGIMGRNAAMDATGGGAVMHSMFWERWSRDIMGVQFGGLASERPCHLHGNYTCKDAFSNRMSELWYAGLDFVRAGQIRGVSHELAREMKARKYELTKSGGVTKIRVEPKADMKARIGFSPDKGDAFMVLLELARTRFGFKVANGAVVTTSGHQDFKAFAMKMDKVNHRPFFKR